MGVQDLRDAPAVRLRLRQALPVVERIDRESLAGVGTGDQVVEVPVGVAGPDSLDDHVISPGCD
jgi:hypothetical protein